MASIAISIALLTLTKDLRPAKEVFGNLTDGSNWNSKGFSFMIGFLSVAVRIRLPSILLIYSHILLE